MPTLNNQIYLIFQISFAFILTNFLIKILLPLLKRNFLDLPNSRSSHNSPKPRGGGISFVTVINIFALLYLIQKGLNFNYLLPIISIPLSIIGFIDDLKQVNSLLRYIFQLSTALIIFIYSPLFSEILKLNFFLSLILFSILIISITAIINFTNFMDGIDGLLAGCTLIFFLIASIMVSSFYVIFFITILSFLFWNWYPSKVFMGDVGSTFLGATMAGVIFQSENQYEFLHLLLIASPIIVDAFTCVIRRFLLGQNIFKPHNLHLYQRLIKAGWKHSSVALIYILATIILSFSTFLPVEYTLIFAFITLTTFIYIDQKIAIKFRDAIEKI